MVRSTVCASVFFLASTALAQEAPPEPQILVAGGMAPDISVVEGLENGHLILRQTQVEPATATRTRPVTEKVIIDGKEEERTKHVQETYTTLVTLSSQVKFDLANIRAFDTNGVPIAASRFPAIFARPRIILLALPGMQVDPAYLKVAKDGTPFVALLSLPLPTPAPAPVPAPAAAPPAAPTPAPPAETPKADQ